MERQAATLTTLSSSRTAVVVGEEEGEEASSKEEEVEEVEEATLTTSAVVEEEVEEGLIITEEVEASTTNAGVITKVIKVVSMINKVVLTTAGEVTGASRTTAEMPGEEAAIIKAITRVVTRATKAATRATKAATRAIIRATKAAARAIIRATRAAIKVVTRVVTKATTRVVTREITKEEAIMMIKLIIRQVKVDKVMLRLIRVTEEDRVEDTTLTRVAINRTSAVRTRVTIRVVVRIKLLQGASTRIIRAIRTKEVIRTTAEEEEVAEEEVAASREVEGVAVEQELLQDLHPQRTRVRTLTKTTMSSLRPFLRALRPATRQRITVDMLRLRVPTIRRLDIRLIKGY